INAGDGDDRVSVQTILADALVSVDGGPGNDILMAGAGNVQLHGGPGRDLLISRGGAHLLDGGTGEDILIGGTTDYDANPAALQAIVREWTRPETAYADRVD